MKVSIITAVYNNQEYISSCMKSVQSQTYSNIEHIIVNGASTDNTLTEINKLKNANTIVISEPDKGMYDAMNKGIATATGDIIGILNADDLLFDEKTIEDIVDEFKNYEVDITYGDIVFIQKENLTKIIRTYSSKNFSNALFKFGYMPPHASIYIRKNIFEKFGHYNTKYKITSDFELILRFFKRKEIRRKYINRKIVKMRMGGVSNNSLLNIKILNKESVRACRENKINTNMIFILMKYLTKIFEFNLWNKLRDKN